jgi:hypothetical protein
MKTNIIILERDEEKRINKYKEVIRESKDVRKVFYTRNLENIKEFCKEDSLILNLNDNPKDSIDCLEKFIKEEKGDIFLVNPKDLKNVLSSGFYYSIIRIIVNMILSDENASINFNLFIEDDVNIVIPTNYKILSPYGSFVCYTSNLDDFLELYNKNIELFESVLNNFVNIFDPDQVKSEIDKKLFMLEKERIEKETEIEEEKERIKAYNKREAKRIKTQNVIGVSLFALFYFSSFLLLIILFFNIK